MTLSEREAARERVEALAHLPWRNSNDADGNNPYTIQRPDGYSAGFMHTYVAAEFVVNAPTDLRLALDALDAADAEIARLKERIAHLEAALCEVQECKKNGMYFTSPEVLQRIAADAVKNNVVQCTFCKCGIPAGASYIFREHPFCDDDCAAAWAEEQDNI